MEVVLSGVVGNSEDLEIYLKKVYKLRNAPFLVLLPC